MVGFSYMILEIIKVYKVIFTKISNTINTQLSSIKFSENYVGTLIVIGSNISSNLFSKPL